MMWFAIAAGAVAGAPARFVTDRAVTRRWPGGRLPWGTILVNVVGSAVLGVMAGLTAAGERQGVAYAAVGTGFCGAFTTFSTFTWETLALAEDGHPIAALLNVSVSLVLGLSAATVGYLAVA